MPNILKNNVHATLADAFYAGILNRTMSAYFFLGRTLPWDDIEDTPPEISQSYADEYSTRQHILTTRRVLDTELSYVIPRVDWQSGTIYDMYDISYTEENPAQSGALDIIDANMFVMTDDFNMYKCISNNYGAASTVKPTGTSLSYITLADGYVWKYMMPMSILSRSRFLSANYMPVQNSITDSFYSPGLTPILVNGGSGYIEDNCLIQVIGDGINAIFEPVIVDGQITNINVINPGSGYTNAIVVVSTPDPNKAQGSGADIEIDLNTGDLASSQSDVQLSAIDGELSFIYITNGGSGYTSAPTINIIGDGSGAAAQAVITDGVITDINFVNRGSGYTWATVTITGGSGNGALARVITSPVGGHGHNIIKETYSDTLCFYMDTTEDINQGLNANNDYRQAGIIINPDRYTTGGTRLKYISDRGSPCWRASTTNVSTNPSSLGKDYMLKRQGDGEIFYIVEYDDQENIVLLSLTGASPVDGNTFLDSDDVALFDITSVVNPEIDRFSGKMIYVDNKPPYRESEDQNVILKTYIQF